LDKSKKADLLKDLERYKESKLLLYKKLEKEFNIKDELSNT
jgi:hypothetical protein